MTAMKARLHDHILRVGIAGGLLAAAACTGDTNLVRDVAVATGVGTEPKPAPDFVASSRPGEVDYIRPGVAPRSTKAKSADEVKAMEAAMEQTRTANEGKAAAARELGARSGPGPTAPRNP
jgi:hypothetical protein